VSGGDPDFIESIGRGFAVLLAFDARQPNPTLAQLAATTQISRPAVRRILLTLQRLGYVSGSDGRWALTPRVLSIGQHYSAAHTLLEAAMPRLVHVAEQTDESASLGVLDGADVVYAARVPVRRIMSIDVSVGTRIPAYATSMGRALLAWAPPSTVKSVFDVTEFTKLTVATITDARSLRDELARVRARGYSVVAEELEKGLISLSAPVFDVTGGVVGAIACSTSTARNTPEDFTAAVAAVVVDAAGALSADMGYRPDH
jgi:IclR family pca regulon transcriptional regulator